MGDSKLLDVINEQSAELHEQDKLINTLYVAVSVLSGLVIMLGLVLYYKSF